MSEKERKKILAEMRKYAVQLSKNKEEAKAFLVRTGIITEKGNLRRPYRHLCILRDLG